MTRSARFTLLVLLLVAFAVSLGNVRTKLGRREDAIRRRSVLPDDPFRAETDAHVARPLREPLHRIAELQNPWAE